MKRKIEITLQKNRIPCNISNLYQDESLNDTHEIKSLQAKPQTNNKSKFSNPKNDLNQSQHKIVHINYNTFNATFKNRNNSASWQIFNFDKYKKNNNKK